MMSLRSKKEVTVHALTKLNSRKRKSSKVQFDEMNTVPCGPVFEMSHSGEMNAAVPMEVDTNDEMNDARSCDAPKPINSRNNTPLRLRGGAMPGLQDRGGSLNTINGNTFAEGEKHTTAIDKPKVAIYTFHLSCASDMFNPNLSYSGMVIYGTYALNGHRIRPGYVVIMNANSAVLLLLLLFLT